MLQNRKERDKVIFSMSKLQYIEKEIWYQSESLIQSREKKRR